MEKVPLGPETPKTQLVSYIHLTYESCKQRYFYLKYEYFGILGRDFSKLKPDIEVLMLVSMKHAAGV